ncbi:BTB-POZ domain-containing protein [Pyrenophora teres f. maculata]|nr:BTB-POZ domain-containing protein [Pyrenophora teres f. maculata]
MATDEAPKDRSLFNDPTFSDFKIRQICNGKTKEYYSHKVMLCSRSAYFRKALMGSFKEASEDSMDIHDDNPDHFEAMLRYIYTDEYEPPLNASAFEMGFLFPIGVYILADKYDVEGLGEEAADYFGCGKRECSDGTCNHTPTPLEAVSMIRAYYETCSVADSEMGVCISAFVLRHMKIFLGQPLFRDLSLQYPMFATDVLLTEYSWKSVGKCTHKHR